MHGQIDQAFKYLVMFYVFITIIFLDIIFKFVELKIDNVIKSKFNCYGICTFIHIKSLKFRI